LTGFGNNLAKGVKQAIADQGLMGAFTGGFSSAAGGVCAAMFFGLLVSLLFRPNDKNKK
jgi:stage V sporulation protein AE